MNGRRWLVLSSKGQLSTARLLPRASICVWSAVWVGFSAESAMANLEPNRSGSANNVSMTSSWHTYSSSHNFVRPPSPAPILTGQAKPLRGGEFASARHKSPKFPNATLVHQLLENIVPPRALGAKIRTRVSDSAGNIGARLQNGI